MKKNIPITLSALTALLFMACTSSQYVTTGHSYEDDEVYLQKGETFITDTPVSTTATSDASQPADDDYYDPQSATDNRYSSPNSSRYDDGYYGNNYYNNYGWNNFSYRPQYSMMWDPYLGWHLGLNYSFGNNYSGWNQGYYNPYNDPWYNDGWGYNGWGYSPGLGYYGNNYYGGGYYSPWSSYGYGYGSGVGHAYPWWNTNDYPISSAHRNNLATGSSVNSTYNGDTYHIEATRRLPMLGKPDSSTPFRYEEKTSSDPSVRERNNYAVDIFPTRTNETKPNVSKANDLPVQPPSDGNRWFSRDRHSAPSPSRERERPAPQRDNGFSTPDYGRTNSGSFDSGRSSGSSTPSGGGNSRHR